jgi:hypothetical protein
VSKLENHYPLCILNKSRTPAYPDGNWARMSSSAAVPDYSRAPAAGALRPIPPEPRQGHAPPRFEWTTRGHRCSRRRGVGGAMHQCIIFSVGWSRWARTSSFAAVEATASSVVTSLTASLFLYDLLGLARWLLPRAVITL